MRDLSELRYSTRPQPKNQQPALWRVIADAQADGIDVASAIMAAGYSEEEAALFTTPFEEGPSCTVCHDQGQYFDKDTQKNEVCTCDAGQRIMQVKIEASRKESQIPTKYARFTWDTWEHELTEQQKTGKNLAFVAAWLFANNDGHYFRVGECYPLLEQPIPKELENDMARNSLVLYGPYGTGKTGLMAATANHLMTRKPIMYTRVSALVERIQETYEKAKKRKDGPTRGDIIEKASTVPVLLLDEFGGQNGSKDRRGIMEEIMRNRCSAELPFIATTNHNPDQFRHEWEDRITEVVLESAHWIPCGGPNLRQKSQVIRPI